jgi:hypothetical protein
MLKKFSIEKMPRLKIKYFVALCFAKKSLSSRAIRIAGADEYAKVMFFVFSFFIYFIDEPPEALFVLIN